MKLKEYQNPDVEIIRLNSVDVITESNDDNYEGGDYEGLQ